jgi:methanogen homocitrate synthase
MKMEMIEGIKVDNVPYFNENYWVSPINYMPEIKGKYPSEALIYDVTLRDGEQTPGVCWNEDERVRVAEAMEEIGLKRIEIGMPVVSDSIGRAVKRLINRNTKLDMVALCRSKNDDIDMCEDIGLKSVIVEHSINPYLCKYALDLSVEKLLDRLITSIIYAKEKGMNVNFFGWDAFRCDIPYLQKIYGTIVKEAKPDSVTLTDTFGVALPSTVKMTVEKVKEVIGDTPLEFHGHNEFGFGTGAALAALEGGASGLHTSVNGLGERTGNVPTEEVVMSLELLLGINTGIDLSKIYELSNLVSEISKVPIEGKKPIVGSNLTQVESGLVSDVVYRMNKIGVKTGMAPFTQELVGGKPQEYAIGKGSGRATVQFYLEKNGINPETVSKEQVGNILEEVKIESRIRKALLSEANLMFIVNKELNK